MAKSGPEEDSQLVPALGANADIRDAGTIGRTSALISDEAMTWLVAENGYSLEISRLI